MKQKYAFFRNATCENNNNNSPRFIANKVLYKHSGLALSSILTMQCGQNYALTAYYYRKI